jgi:hypothetical protein
VCSVTVSATTLMSWTSGDGALRVAIRQGATNSNDNGHGSNIAYPPSGANAWVSGTASAVVSVTAGQSYQFGCSLSNTGSFSGQNYFCRVAYDCQ